MNHLATAALVGSLAMQAQAHGLVSGIVANGKYHLGYNPSFQYQDPPPVVVGWSIPEDQDLGFVAPSAYANPDIICHKGATNAGTHATVKAGSKVELQWTAWPESHHGPVLDYLAACPGKCEDADKAALEFFKIDGVGLLDGSAAPGVWASDRLIANNNSWTVTIPASIKPGNYVLRHEIIALHSAGNDDGAQNYPQCVNLQVTGAGTDVPAGVRATELYKADDPGILVNIYQPLSSYKVPGPAKYKAGAASAPATSTTAKPKTKTKAPTTTTTAEPTLTSTFSDSFTTSATAAPTVTATPPAQPPSISPEAPPKGTTLKDLLSWLAYKMEKARARAGKTHARDFRRAVLEA